MNPKSAIQKGKELENHIADQIVAHGLDSKATRTIGSGNGNREKADINTSLTILGRNVGIEAKNHKTLHIQEWWKQTQKLELVGREPILAFKMPYQPLESTLCVIYLDTLLKLLKQANLASGEAPKPTSSPQDQRELQWAINAAKVALGKLSKLL